MSDRASLTYGLKKIEIAEYEDAFRLLIPHAEEGNVDACSKVGVLQMLTGSSLAFCLRMILGYAFQYDQTATGEGVQNSVSTKRKMATQGVLFTP